MQSPQAKLKEISRLVGSWPSAAVAIDGQEQLRSYLLAVEDYPLCDVEEAVSALIKGTAPGVNPNFLPPPAVVGAESRRQNHVRCEREARDKALRPALPPPDVPRDADSLARVKAMVDGAVAKMAVGKAADDAARDARLKAQWDRTNEVFAPDLSDDETSRRLGFTAGDRDGDLDAA